MRSVREADVNKNLNGGAASDDAAPLRRIVGRIYDRLGGDALTAFIRSRAPELSLELLASDDALPSRLSGADPPTLLIWSQQAGETDPISQAVTALGTARRLPVILMVDRYDAALVSRAMAHGIAGLVSRQMSAD